jgi:hypothetical protein
MTFRRESPLLLAIASVLLYSRGAWADGASDDPRTLRIAVQPAVGTMLAYLR